MKERAKELKKGRKSKVDPEVDLLEKIAEMPDEDRVLAERIHALISAEVPELSPRTWYGQPAYAKGGKVLCFFQAAAKFGTDYATFGFNEAPLLDNGTMWPTAFGLRELTPADEELLVSLVKKAAG
ncbi:iron chaperone [Jiangella endophytica]|uniref:iron chaperone n=1 Tax=Jiangella endophytica TaxID=1623398 RepID=UPI000E34CF55